MPGISDPGSRLIKACIAENIPVEVLPGPNAAVTALVFSGLPTERFLFLGFLPRGGSKRQRLLESLKLEPGTLVIYEAANRTLKTLADLANFLGDRPASVVRELTKLHQEVLRGTLTSLTHHFHETSPRGEVTLLCGGCPQKQTEEPVDLEAEIGERLSRGESPREIATALAVFGRRTVYQKALAMRKQQG
jgi:16S rRNA (cytidine1402-2'-O)-methyltransferase